MHQTNNVILDVVDKELARLNEIQFKSKYTTYYEKELNNLRVQMQEAHEEELKNTYSLRFNTNPIDPVEWHATDDQVDAFRTWVSSIVDENPSTYYCGNNPCKEIDISKIRGVNTGSWDVKRTDAPLYCADVIRPDPDKIQGFADALAKAVHESQKEFDLAVKYAGKYAHFKTHR